LDGRLTDTVWDLAQPITNFYAYRSGGSPAASTTSARILWDDEFLYLGLEMSDADIRPSALTSGSSGRDGNLYEGDVIEFFARPQSDSPQYFEFEWSPNGDVFDARFDQVRFGPPGIGWDTQVSGAVDVEGTWDDATDQDVGWTVETRIPRDAFPAFVAGHRWRFTVARYDYFHPDHAAAQLMMTTPGDPELPNAGLSAGFHSYEFYDELVFVFAVPEPTGIAPLVLALVLCRKLARHFVPSGNRVEPYRQ
jgi:hypothetical protein